MRTSIAALVLIGTVSIASAQSAGQHYRSVDDIDLVNTAGERIGEVEEILIGPDGAPAGVLVDFGGFLGLGDRDVVLPLEAVTYANGVYQTGLSQDDLKQLPDWDD